MAGLKALKLRIGSVKSTRKITKAMKMVAATKLRRAQEAAVNAKPYSKSLEAVISNLSGSVKDIEDNLPLFSGTGKDDHILLVIMTADRGLCGGFNGNIIRYAKETILSLREAGKKISIITVGRRAKESFIKFCPEYILDSYCLSEVKKIDFDFASLITNKIISYYQEGRFDICDIISSSFQSILSQAPKRHQIIPITISADSDTVLPYEIEPNPQTVLENILPQNLTVQIYTSLLENLAGEHASRMTAMENATKNAGDMINRLTLQYNRSRQANITKELIEIISGAEAL